VLKIGAPKIGLLSFFLVLVFILVFLDYFDSSCFSCVFGLFWFLIVFLVFLDGFGFFLFFCISA